jgi:hypothetical protein
MLWKWGRYFMTISSRGGSRRQHSLDYKEQIQIPLLSTMCYPLDNFLCALASMLTQSTGLILSSRTEHISIKEDSCPNSSMTIFKYVDVHLSSCGGVEWGF